MIITGDRINWLNTIVAENDWIRCEMVPELGGKIVSIFNKSIKKEFLWSDQSLQLQLHAPGTDYDSHFWGGFDELIPNDLPETIDGIAYPDHGELWTLPLNYDVFDERIIVYGILPLSGLYYEKILSLDEDLPLIYLHYRIINHSGSVRNFMWKLHAALAINGGDKLITTARKARVADTDYSRFKQTDEFDWPMIEEVNASVIPFRDNTMDFFYLYDMSVGKMQLEDTADKSRFIFSYDPAVFPYQWYFASYGKFSGHYTAVLEPCSTMPISVNEAKRMDQCSMLLPGCEINTVVRIYAGNEIKDLSHG